MVKRCRQCGQDFEILDEDLKFYERIKVPPPTICFYDRLVKRCAFRNDKNFYKRKCDLCGKEIVTIYSADKTFKVYCKECFWKDEWNALDYGREFDFNSPFFKQFAELQKNVPRIGMFHTKCVNCDYTVHTSKNKNCYLSDSLLECEDVMYSSWVFPAKNCMDCLKCEKIEKCYWCSDCIGCFNSVFLELCSGVSDSYLCFDCKNGNNLVGCVGVRNQDHKILNKDVSAEEIQNVRAKLRSDPDFRRGFRKKFEELKLKIPKKYMWSRNCQNCTGNYIDNSKNAHYAFEASDIEDGKYVTQSAGEKDVMDIHQAGWGELLYEIHASIELSFSKFSNLCYHSSYLEYCDNVQSSHNCFGCISLKRNKYCILNKQYSKEKYEKLLSRIIDHMKKTGEYGEFFPAYLSPFCYNESQAQIYFPLKKDEVLRRGYKWKEVDEKEVQMQTYKIPENIDQVGDEILDEVLVCEECGCNYKIIARELAFYRNMGVFIPKKCYQCRHKERVSKRTKWELSDRKCSNCGKNIKTAYPPDSKVVIYCEKCYLEEVY